MWRWYNIGVESGAQEGAENVSDSECANNNSASGRTNRKVNSYGSINVFNSRYAVFDLCNRKTSGWRQEHDDAASNHAARYGFVFYGTQYHVADNYRHSQPSVF